jgi:hypothetical protein
MIELGHTVGPSSRSACCDLTDEVVILDLSSGIYFGLQGVGSAVWRQIQTPKTVQQVVDAILLEYEVSREECEAKVIGFLEELAAHGLIAVDQYASA